MRKITVTILATLIATTLLGQTSMSFYHLGKTTYQNSELNPAWVPEGRLFIGLPVLSGIHWHANNKLSYNDLFTRESDNSILLDIDKGITNLQKENLTSFQANVNLFHVGFKFPAGAFISVFANERVQADVLYPKKLIEFAWNGSDGFLDDKIKIGNVGLTANHFREIGVGYAYSVNSQIDFGVRVKYLMGFLNASVPGNAKADFTTSAEFFQIDANLENAQLRTAGLDIYSGDEGDIGSHLVSSGNTGFAIDIGGEYKLNRYYSIAGSILDLGFINWKTNVVNQTLNDTTFTYSGVNLDGVGDLVDVLEDSLFDKFDIVETNESYRAWLPVRAYGSWIYHYDRNMDFYASLGARLVQGQLKFLYGGGITRKFGRIATLSATALKMPQQFINIGAAFAVNGGPVQLYMAADQVINFSAPDFKAFDFRFGINFRFRGRDTGLTSNSSVTNYSKGFGKSNNDGTLDGPKGVDSGSFLGKKVKNKKRDEIYSIIPRQKKPDVDTEGTPKKKVQPNSPGPTSPPKPFFKKSINQRKSKVKPDKKKKKKVIRKSLTGRSKN
ncbi:MAG: DUF5723 family protein [Cyclobacteriaceae bacterium]